MELLAREHVHLNMLTKSQIEEIQEKANNWQSCELVLCSAHLHFNIMNEQSSRLEHARFYIIYEQSLSRTQHYCELINQTKIFVIIKPNYRRYYLDSKLLLTKYPYLSKFEHFHQLFNIVSASVYFVDYETLHWLKKKNKSYLFKQRMI